MNIIIEGCDGTGKTKIANFLSEALKMKIFHCTGSMENTFEFYDQLLKENDNLIFDRHYIGELIYPSIFKREQKLTENQAWNLNDIYKNKVCQIILTDRNIEIKLRLIQLKEDKKIIDKCDIINNSFIYYSKFLNIKLFNSNEEKRIFNYVANFKRENKL